MYSRGKLYRLTAQVLGPKCDLIRVSGRGSSSNRTRSHPQKPSKSLQTTSHSTLCPQTSPTPLPTTNFQQLALSAMHYRYLRIPLPADIDRGRLLNACEVLMNRHDSLRTAFAAQDGYHGKTVVQIVHPPAQIQFEEHHDVLSLDRHCDEDTQNAVEPPVDGKPPFKVQIVTLQDSRLFLVLRFTHAQWDGCSQAPIANDLSSAYNGLPLQPTMPYFQHALAAWASHTDAARETWRQVLEGAQMTKIHARLLPLHLDGSVGSQRGTKCQVPYTVKITQTIPKAATSSLPANISRGTVVKAAWAVILMRFFPRQRTSDQIQVHDIVFGQVTRGRFLGVPHESNIVGPCTNIVPVRLRIAGPSIIKLELLRKVQQLYLDTRAYENVAFDYIVKRCTPWASDTAYGSIVRYQNYDFSPVTWLEGMACKGSLYGVPNRPSETANIAIFPLETELSVVMTVSNQTLNEKQAQYIVGEFCKLVQEFSSGCGLDEPINLQSHARLQHDDL